MILIGHVMHLSTVQGLWKEKDNLIDEVWLGSWETSKINVKIFDGLGQGKPSTTFTFSV